MTDYQAFVKKHIGSKTMAEIGALWQAQKTGSKAKPKGKAKAAPVAKAKPQTKAKAKADKKPKAPALPPNSKKQALFNVATFVDKLTPKDIIALSEKTGVDVALMGKDAARLTKRKAALA